MNRQKIILLFSALIILGFATIIVFVVFVHRTPRNELTNNKNQFPSSETLTFGATSSVVQPANAFVSAGKNDVILPQIQNTPTPTPLSSTGSLPTETSGVEVTQSSSLSSMETPTTTSALVLPDVSDSEITINSSGASTALNYLMYFSKHFEDITFDNQKFSTVLKDKNGVILAIPGLIEKAIADNNFSEVTSSLSVEKEYTQAEIKFLASIPVTGAAVVINKENIGLEELMDGVIDKALEVPSGVVSKADFISYYGQFTRTARTARQALAAQVSVSAPSKPMSFFDRILEAFGIGTKVNAQVVDTPFGGTVDVLLDCPCDLGTVVTIGPPAPAFLFVSDAFLLTPLFFDDKTMSEGAWWLGLYDDISLPIPCLVPAGAGCAVDDEGQPIIMTGTS
jgi:hypothetical protein